MTGGKLELLDDDAFYDSDDFGVIAVIAGASEPGLFDQEEIEDDDRLAIKPVFRCRNRYDEGGIMTILAKDYVIEAVQPIETGEYVHVLHLNAA